MSPYSKDQECSEYQVFNYVHGLFAAFCSVLVRMHLNYAVEHFQNSLSQISLRDEGNIIKNIISYARDLLLKFLYVNFDFFMNFLICLARLIRAKIWTA